MNRILSLIAIVAIAGCSNSATVPTPAPTRQVNQDDASMVVARIDGEAITLAEIEKPIISQIVQKQQELHDLRASSLERIVAERLLEREAAKRGLTAEQLIEQEVFAKVGEPTEEEIRAFYDQRKGMPGLPSFEDARGPIRQVLGQEKALEATQAFFEGLKAAAKVEILLERPEMPRQEVEAKGPSRGPENAPVTIVEFSDFECPFCGQATATLAQVEEAYAGKVRVVFRDFPLSFHRNAQKAAEAGHCADEQGKFWEMHDKMFANQRALDVASLKTYAKDIGLDAAAFDACLDSGKKAALVRENLDAGMQLGVRGTPAFFINGRMVAGAIPFADFAKIIDQELGIESAAATP